MQEVVSHIDDENKLLEPSKDIAIKGYYKKIWVLDTKLWRWGESNSRPNWCNVCVSTVCSQFFDLKLLSIEMTKQE